MATTPFIFQDFGADANRDTNGFVPLVKEDIPPERRSYRAHDVAEAERKGHEAGYQEGLAAGIRQGQTAEAEINRALTASLQGLEKQFSAFFQHYAALLEQSAQDAASLAISIARKVAGEALDTNAEANIAALVQQCMGVVFGQSDVVITLHPEMQPAVEARITPLLNQNVAHGKVHYKTDGTIEHYDCSITWKDGGARLDTPGTWAKIEAILAQHGLMPASPAATATPTPTEE